jgi:hypothetical protein
MDSFWRLPKTTVYNLLGVPSNEGLKPTRFRQYLETQHSDCANKPVDFFSKETQRIKAKYKLLYHTATGSSNLKAVEALH